MKRLILSIGATAAMLALPALASAQPGHSEDSKKVDLHVSRTLAVGATVLKEGDYKVQCKFIDGQHVLVVTSADDGSEVARVPCTPEMLDGKPTLTEFRSIIRPDGTSALSAVRIKGDQNGHRVAKP
jgi:hypothetical protein